MKTLSLKDSPRALHDLSEATREGYILLTRRGKPVAYILPTKFYDEEDIEYMTDPAFWKMIRRRQKETGPAIPLEQVMNDMEAAESVALSKPRNGKFKHPAKGKRNAAA